MCHSRDELISVINNPKRCSDYVVQEYIEFDKEISILGAVLENGEVLLSGCIDKLRTCMIGTTSFGVMVDNMLLGDTVTKLKTMMKRTGYRGLFSAEFLKMGDIYYFLEINFRNDGNTYVATASGLNLPLYYINSFINNYTLNIEEQRFPCYFMLDIEDFCKRHKNKLSLIQWINDYKAANCYLVKNAKDNAPFKKKILLTILNPFQIVLRKLGLKWQK